MRARIAMLSLLTFIVVAGCDNRDAMSGKGFSLPDGDPLVGAEVFLYMQCNQCHTIRGEELPPIPMANPPYVELGGFVSRVKTYSELITAIINPSHKLASGYAKHMVSENDESKMHTYNEYMTVQELIDLVMYLQAHYDVVPPAYTHRPYY